jgi:hypothetical protein
MKSLAVAWFALLVTARVAGALAFDLGEDLRYVRLERLSEDLPVLEQTWATASTAIDARGVSADETSARALAAALKKSAPSKLRLVLVNADTAPALLAALPRQTPGVLILGPQGTAAALDLGVETTLEADRRAVAALARGAAPATVLPSPAEKTRQDEASLVRERHGASAAPTAPAEPAVPRAETPAAPLDLVLQRALQLHRALLALRRF